MSASDAIVIDLNPGRPIECAACGEEDDIGHGLPVDDTGAFVDNDFEGDWAGVPACKRCHDFHAKHGAAALDDLIARLRA